MRGRAVATVLAAVVLASCGGGGGGGGGSDSDSGGVERLARIGGIADIDALPDGDLLVAERATGRILRVHDGATTEVASVDVVAEPGQRGLLAVLADGDDVYATWTRASDGHLVVGRVLPSAALVWVGPASTKLANGGRLAMVGGSLVIGIGDLMDPAKVPDPATPNGKLLRLDPSGLASQRPVVISSGWHNPFAFTVRDDGSVWVADNAPGHVRERLASGDLRTVVELDGTAAPSGVLADGRDLLVCGYVSGELRRYPPGSKDYDVVASGCRYDVDRLADGRIVMADDDGVVAVRGGR